MTPDANAMMSEVAGGFPSPSHNRESQTTQAGAPAAPPDAQRTTDDSDNTPVEYGDWYDDDGNPTTTVADIAYIEKLHDVATAARRLKLMHKRTMRLLPNAAWTQLQAALRALDGDA